MKSNYKIVFYGDNSTEKYEGRLVGCITEAQYEAIRDHPEILNKVHTSESSQFTEICNRLELTKYLRLLLATNYPKKLVVTWPIHIVTQSNLRDSNLVCVNKHGAWFELTPL